MPFRLGSQTIDHESKIVRKTDGLGQRPVLRRNLIERRRRQRFVDQADRSGDRAFDARHDEIEVVERAKRDLPHGAALGRLRIDVVETLEALRIFDVAEQRKPMPPFEAGLRRSARSRSVAPARTLIAGVAAIRAPLWRRRRRVKAKWGSCGSVYWRSSGRLDFRSNGATRRNVSADYVGFSG